MRLKRSSGVLCHPVSFHTAYGIGDFGPSAYDFVDFLHQAGQSYWQILPLGHTGYGDSPYQCISTFAGNPLLISPDILAEDGLLIKEDFREFFADERHKGLGGVIDYGAALGLKSAILNRAYDNFCITDFKEIKSEFSRFCKGGSRQWLDDYAFFVAYKNLLIDEREQETDKTAYQKWKVRMKGILGDAEIDDCYYGASLISFPQTVLKGDKKEVSALRKKLTAQTDYIKFVQYIFYRQWKRLKAYANEHNIKIIGDLPIFVSLDSADVWAEPKLFQLGRELLPTDVAGVPPDYFSETGQLWGNPLYNWPEHQKTGYKWWINRMSSALELYDLVRLDHFRGFESYWAVPYGEKTAERGRWEKGPGKPFFDALSQAFPNLPLIAEDLGIITDKVTALRDSLGLPGMKILQYAFDDDPENLHKPHNYDGVNTVVYTGTHDNDTTAGWYKSVGEELKDRFRRYLNVSGQEASWDMIRLAMMSCAALSVYPVQDILSLGSEARLNTPGKLGGNWSFMLEEGALREWMSDRLRYLTELYDRG